MNIARTKLWFRRRLKFPAWCRDVLCSAIVAYSALYLVLPTPAPLNFLKMLSLGAANAATFGAFDIAKDVSPALPAPGSGEIGYALDLKIMDLWFSLRGKIAPPQDVLIIGVDEESHNQLKVPGLAPWPRELQAALLERIAAFKPRLVLVDYSFRDRVNAETDIRLAAALKLSPTLLVRAEKVEEFTAPDGKRSTRLLRLDPLHLFEEAAGGTFLANLPMDRGVVRGFKMVSKGGDANPGSAGELVPSMAQALFGADLSNRKLPNADDFLNFYGPPGSIPSLSFYEALQSEAPRLDKAVRGKIVFIGQRLLMSYAAQQTDTFMTPFSVPMSGVEIHATAAANVLDGSFIRGAGGGRDTLVFFLSALLLIYLLFSSTGMRGILVLACSSCGWLIASYYLFGCGIFLPGASLVFGIMPLTYAALSMRTQLSARRLEKALGVSK